MAETQRMVVMDKFSSSLPCRMGEFESSIGILDLGYENVTYDIVKQISTLSMIFSVIRYFILLW